MVIVVPLVALMIGGLLGWLLCAQRLFVPVWALAAATLAVMVWAIWQGRQSTGFDGVGFAILALLMCAPALLGLGGGALIAWLRRRRKAG